jgi:hypothetical protein
MAYLRGEPRVVRIVRVVDPVGLHPTGPLIHRNARRVKHVVRDSGRHQKPVQPEPVVARLVTAHHRRNASQRPSRPVALPTDQCQQLGMSSPLQPMAGQSCLCQGCAASPASSSGSVRLQRKLCHNGRWWACLRSMLASDSPMVRVWKPQTYRKGHAHRPMESTIPALMREMIGRALPDLSPRIEPQIFADLRAALVLVKHDDAVRASIRSKCRPGNS